MLRSGAIALLAGYVLGTPVPQGLDFDAIEALQPIATPSIPIVHAQATETTMTFAPTAAASAVAAAVLANPSDTSVAKRGALAVSNPDNAQCASQPSANDTPENFLNDPYYSSTASGASTPAGYTVAYQNKNGSSQGVYAYMGYSVLNSYDTLTCSKRCDAVVGCQSFNIYYERDPIEESRDRCTDPPSTTVIKCVYYGGPVTAASATNDGQYRDTFHVVIAGSNGYVNKSISTPSGYSAPTALANGAINALLDCNGGYTYMGVKIFQDGPFSVDKCAAACSAQSEYNRAHPDSKTGKFQTGKFQTCQSFNTYVLYNGTTSVGQYCSLYNETWPASYATNVGQWRGTDYFSIGYSFSSFESTGNVDQPVGCSNPPNPKRL